MFAKLGIFFCVQEEGAGPPVIPQTRATLRMMISAVRAARTSEWGCEMIASASAEIYINP